MHVCLVLLLIQHTGTLLAWIFRCHTPLVLARRQEYHDRWRRFYRHPTPAKLSDVLHTRTLLYYCSQQCCLLCNVHQTITIEKCRDRSVWYKANTDGISYPTKDIAEERSKQVRISSHSTIIIQLGAKPSPEPSTFVYAHPVCVGSNRCWDIYTWTWAFVQRWIGPPHTVVRRVSAPTNRKVRV